MTEQNYDIHKAAAVILHDRKAVLTRSKGKGVFVPPGGKLEANENEIQACIRELKEELGIDVTADDLEFMDTFYAEAAGGSGQALKMGVYLVKSYTGELAANSEIEEVTEVGSIIPDGMEVGSIFEHNIIPRLVHDNLID